MLVMTEGMGVALDPEFRLGDVLAPYAEQLTLERLSPDAVVRQFIRAGANVADIGKHLPDYARRVVRLLEDGDLEVHLRATEVERLLARMEQANNRLVAGVVAAALIEGVADIMAGDQEHWRGWRRSLLIAGVGAAGVLSAYLVWTTESQSRVEPMPEE
jgi:ubiquinone biosynthesis protein